jgi:hypothetical protein
MADVFISYSHEDRLQVEQLAAFLEAEGWSVWFDRSLTAGEAWRDEIATELVKARAALVVWTQSSIKSDFVRAEAGRAKAEAKPIPVKASGVKYRDIPPPFGEMHTEPMENRELIRAAVVAQLAKPQVVPTGIWLATASVRYAVLAWFAIDLPVFLEQLYTLLFFASATLMGAERSKGVLKAPRPQNPAMSWAVWSFIAFIFIEVIFDLRNRLSPQLLTLGAALIVLIPSCLRAAVSPGGVNTITAVLLFAPMEYVFSLSLTSDDDLGDPALYMILLVCPFLIHPAAIRIYNQRLVFILVGLGILLALNELSKLNLVQYLPAGG